MKWHKLIPFMIAGFSYFTSTGQLSAEINIGSYRLGADMSLRHYIDPGNKWSVSTFNRAFYYHSDKSTGFFTFNSIAYHFKSGIGLSANLSGNNDGFYATLGARYEKKIREFYLYFITTYAPFANGIYEDYLILAYKYPLNNKIKLTSQIEFYTRFEKQEEDHFYERIKLGIQLHNTQIGLFNESFQSSGKNTKPSNFGCYIKRSF